MEWCSRVATIKSMAEKKSKNESKTEVKSEDVPVPAPGEVSVPDQSADAQSKALLHYKLTGIVGDYVDPTKDQEWDIAPEFGIGPHPELHNVRPPDVFPSRQSPGAGQPAPLDNAAVAAKVAPIEVKDKAAEKAADAESLHEGRPDLRGDVNASSALPPQPVVVVEDRSKSDKDK